LQHQEEDNMAEASAETTQRVGTRWKSAACEFIIVHAPSGRVDLACGGHPAMPFGQDAGEKLTPASGGGTQVGKRYTDVGSGLVVLVTKAGEGALTVGGLPLELVQPKLLPSSD
jgi:hypothetical protein